MLLTFVMLKDCNGRLTSDYLSAGVCLRMPLTWPTSTTSTMTPLATRYCLLHSRIHDMNGMLVHCWSAMNWLDNAGDAKGAVRLQGQPQIRHMTCSTEPYGVTAKFGLHNKPVNAMWEFSKVTNVFCLTYSKCHHVVRRAFPAHKAALARHWLVICPDFENGGSSKGKCARQLTTQACARRCQR